LFKYSSIDINFETDNKTAESHIDLESETEYGKVSNNFDAYIEHRGRRDCVFFCNQCNVQNVTNNTQTRVNMHIIICNSIICWPRTTR
jgi:hypothetical protein